MAETQVNWDFIKFRLNCLTKWVKIKKASARAQRTAGTVQKTIKKAPNFSEALQFWVDDRVRTGDPRHHKPML